MLTDMRLFKRVLIIFLVILALVAVAAFVYIDYSTYDAVDVEGAMSRATDENTYYHFSHDDAKANLVFYPGGFVEPEAYAVFARELSLIGLNVFVMRMPLNLAILKSDAALEIKDRNDLPFILAGHSLGGAAATIFLNRHPSFTDILILLAAYPASSSELFEIDLSVLSIYGNKDGVLDFDALENTKNLLPEDTIYHEIEGGNHAYFGNYGEQKGDGTASITRKKQREQTIRAIEEFLADRI